MKKVASRLHFVLLFRITGKISQPNRKGPPRESQVDFSTPLRWFFAQTCTKWRPQAVLSGSGPPPQSAQEHTRRAPRVSQELPKITKKGPKLASNSQHGPPWAGEGPKVDPKGQKLAKIGSQSGPKVDPKASPIVTSSPRLLQPETSSVWKNTLLMNKKPLCKFMWFATLFCAARFSRKHVCFP